MKANANPYSPQSDVYSFGVCLYELLSGRLPYDDIKNRDQILFMVGSGLLRPNLANLRSDTPKKFRQLLEECIRFKPEERPEFRHVGDFAICCLFRTEKDENLEKLQAVCLQAKEFDVKKLVRQMTRHSKGFSANDMHTFQSFLGVHDLGLFSFANPAC